MSAAGESDVRFLKNRRIVSSIAYQSIIANNCRSKDSLFVVYTQKNSRQFGRLGITVSRHVATKAVERNRIKRAIRESFRHQQEILVGLDIVTIARGAAQKAETKQLFVSLERHWQKVSQRRRCISS